jgi:hypothetical protein
MMHRAILRAASMLVPREQKQEWLEEWRAELCYVRRGATRFCLGAFRDAWWLRRNHPASEAGLAILRSPVHCLLVLAALATLSAMAAFQLPGPRMALLANAVVAPARGGYLSVKQYRLLVRHLPAEFREIRYSHGRALARIAAVRLPDSISVPLEGGGQAAFACIPVAQPGLLVALAVMIAMALPVLLATTTVSLGEYRRSSPRLWAFLGAKAALLVIAAFFVPLLLGAPELRPQGMAVCFIVAFRWAIYDQRRRCPVCLKRLTNPVRFGGASHMFLDWYGTELICAEGHGMMHVPEIPASSYPAPRWLSLQA